MSGDKFTEREMLVLSIICDTLAPTLDITPDPDGFFARKATDLEIPALVENILQQAFTAEDRQQFKFALHLLDQPWYNALFGGPYRSIRDLNLDERTKLLRDAANSRIPWRRRMFQAFKRLVMFYFYTAVDANNCNPNWSALSYPGPNRTPIKTEKPIKPLHIVEDTVLEADVVIVGSGAGGGVVAGELSAAGLDVIVLEKGDYHAERDFDGYELTSTYRLFENYGFLTSTDLSMILLAGNTLGGGTTVNWCASVRTPEKVLHEWVHIHGATTLAGQAYQDALDRVSERLNVNENECQMNGQNAVLNRGSETLGYEVNVLPRNVKGCGDCGFCNYGCAHGAKQSTLATYLLDAYKRDTRIVVNATVQQVLTQNGMAIGVKGFVAGKDGQKVELTVNAKTVVVAAGALHTPAILMRSGLTNTNIGRNLHLHPTSVTYGIYDEPIRGWNGVMMSRYVSQFNNLSGDGYGVVLETAPTHPGLAALVMPWADGHQHKTVMRQLANLSNILTITRDRDSGQIILDKNGKPRIQYTLSVYDGTHLMRGVIESLRIHHAAGATELGSPQTPLMTYRTDQNRDFEAFLRSVEVVGIHKNGFALTSAHQMSTCRMGGNPSHGAVAPTGETFEIKNLYVADASVLPTAAGINPMLTIMGVAYLIAQHIKASVNN
jgi:choline dehydrogenase-like flavoprotein